METKETISISDEKTSELSRELREMRREFSKMQVQIAKLETVVEERTLRIVHARTSGVGS